MLITFSGLDGSGKTTLVGLLQASLARRDVRATVSHMYRDVGVYAMGKALARRLGRGAKPKSVLPARRESAPGVIWNRSLRLLVYPLDLLIFACYRLYVEGLKRHVLIMDRYFYDTLVDVSFRQGRSRAASLLSRLTPAPSVAVLLDISPAAAYARKGEHDVQFLERKRAAYRAVFPDGGRGLVLEADGDVDETLRAVESAIRERMGAR